MKKVLYVILGLVAVYLILCLVGKSESKVERSIEVNASADVTKAAIADHKVFYEKWSPWTEKDPQMKVSYEGEVGKPGHKMSWESDKKEVGKGSMTLNAFNGDSIIQTLHFDDYGDSKIYHIVKEENGKTNITWGMQSKTPFMFRGMMMFMDMEGMIAPDFEKGLSKLKAYVESAPAAPTAANYEVKELDWTEKTFIGKRQLVTFDKIPAFFGENLGAIMGELGKNKIEPTMAPLGIFWTFDEQKQETDMAAAMSVAKGTKLKGFETWEIPASKVLHIAYYGDYSKTMGAHMAMDEYMKKNNMKQSLVVEEYANDPGVVKDTAQWLTNIYYILAPAK